MIMLVNTLLAFLILLPLSQSLQESTLEEPRKPAASDPLQRIIVVGDVHGDLEQLQAALTLGGLLNQTTKVWTAGSSARLVLLGDLIDRGPQDVQVLDFVRQLQLDARHAGSEVVVLLGNHEVMNLNGDLHYVHPESMKAYGGKAKHRMAFQRDGEYGAWLRTFPVVYTEWETLFVHAGLLPKYAALGLPKLLELAQQELALLGELKESSKRHQEHDILGVDGPIWTRRVVHRGSHGDCQLLYRTLDTLKLERMVVGHTPEASGDIGVYCDDRLFVVDVGMSRWMYGNLAIMEMTRHPTDGRVELRQITAASHTDEAASRNAEEPAETLEEELRRDPKRLHDIFETVRQAQRWRDNDEGDL